MRKAFFICLIALCLISCSKGNETRSSQADAPKGFVVGIEQVEEKAKETVKGVTEAIKEVVQTPANAWRIIEEKDSFGDLTGKKEVVLSDQKGTFNSSPYGITDGELDWEFHCNESSAWVILKEKGYDGNLSTAYYKSDTFTIKVKADDGNTKTISKSAAIGLNGGSYNRVDIPSFTIKEMLVNNNSLKIVIDCNNGNGSYNLGAIDCSACNEDMFFKGKNIIEENSNISTHKQVAELINIIKAADLDKDSKDHYVNKLKQCTFDYPNYSGGIIFYDCDEDNDSGNADGLKSSECGWRYLEATREFEDEFRNNKNPGSYKPEYPYSVAGVYEGKTESEIGTGKNNTEVLVNAIGDETRMYSSGKDTTSEYAARICFEYEYNGYDDWFLPSKDELEKLIETCKPLGLLYVYEDYWSSTTVSGYAKENAWGYPVTYYSYYSEFSNKMETNSSTDVNNVWPVRAFK